MKRLFLATALAALASVPATAQQIGTVASTEPTLRGTPPGAATRTLGLGTGVVSDETVQSSASGRGQLLFLDQTTLSLAPNTTIVLDRFVFDPDQGAGEIGLQLTEGALRFIGGTLSRDQDATITTPTSTIGIRGSSGIVLYSNGRTIAIFIAGDRMCVVAGGSRNCTSRAGGVVTEDGYQGRVSPEFLAFLLGLIDGAPVRVATGGTSGSGIGGAVGPGDGPFSPDGESFDLGIFGEDFGIDTLISLFDREPPETFDDEEDEFDDDFLLDEI